MLRLDDLQNGYQIWQDPELFCFGVDAVLLAHYPKLKQNDRILDMGCGFGPIPLILLAEAKKQSLKTEITGLELQSYVAEIAQTSVAYNHVEDCIRIVNGDIREARTLFPAASFSLITCNPPYMPVRNGLVGSSRAKAIARTELECTLEDVCQTASKLLRPQGRFAMIHRPSRIPEIIETMRRYHLEPKRMQLVHPYPDADATMVLIEALRGGKSYLTVDPPMVIYEKPQVYTKELLKLYGRETKQQEEG